MDTHNQYRDTDLAILSWLARFGYLTPAQIGRLAWPQAATQASCTRLAQLAIARLSAAGLLLVRRSKPCLPTHVGLSRRGALVLHRQVGIHASSAKDLLRTTSRHRDACNDTTIALLKDWPTVWTEREIVTGGAPFREFGGKVPDCAAFDPEVGVLWIEVENCRRGGRDMDSLANWLNYWAFPDEATTAFLDCPRDNLPLARVRFVLATPAAASFPSRLARAMAYYNWQFEEARNQIEFIDVASGKLTLW
jgi:hypothetical protein